MAASFSISNSWGGQIERRDRERFDRQVASRVGAIRDSMDDYENALRAERAFFDASGEVDRGEFRVFAEGLRLSERYPGMQGVGFQAYVRGADLDAFVGKARRTGAPDFKITPPGRRSEYFVVLFNEPEAKFGVTWGFDARSNPSVRPYLERARDTGRSTLSGKAVLGVDLKLPEAKRPVAFGLFVPVYARGVPTGTPAERRAAFRGWASSPFRAQDFLDGAMRDSGRPLGAQLFDETASSENLIASYPKGFVASGDLVRTRDLEFAGRRWRLRFAHLPAAAAAADTKGPKLLLLAGLLLSAMLAGLVLLLGRERRARAELAQALAEKERAEALVAATTSELERSNAELEQFAHVVSHDLQEPLRTLAGFGDLLERRYGDRLDADGRGYLAHIREGAGHMKRLIDGVLEYAKVGRTALRRGEVDTREVAHSALRSLGAAADASGAEVEISDELPTVFADAEQLAQVFQNLIGNALKYVAEDKPRVSVNAGHDGSQWEFAIADNGIGIDPDAADQVFAVFSRVPTERKYDGSGIGLAVTQRIVEHHGGRIWFTAAPGGGTVFHFTLPGEARQTADGDRPMATAV